MTRSSLKKRKACNGNWSNTERSQKPANSGTYLWREKGVVLESKAQAKHKHLYPFHEIPQIAQVKSDNFDGNGGGQHRDQDEFVEIVEMLVFERCDQNRNDQPEREVAHIEEQTHLKREVSNDFVAQSNLRGFAMQAVRDPGEHGFGNLFKGVFGHGTHAYLLKMDHRKNIQAPLHTWIDPKKRALRSEPFP